MAQGGLLAASLVLVTTMTILYQGSRATPSDLPKRGHPVVIGEHSTNQNVKLASTGK
jgi:hypothetical protein